MPTSLAALEKSAKLYARNRLPHAKMEQDFAGSDGAVVEMLERLLIEHEDQDEPRMLLGQVLSATRSPAALSVLLRAIERKNDELHVRSDFLLGKESDSRSVIVAFVLSNNVLFSVHDEDLPVFQRFRMRSHGQPDLVADSRDVLIDLYGSDVEFSADALEETYADLGGISGTVLNSTLSDKEAGIVLANIAHAEHLNGRIRRNLMDTRRAVSFMMRSKFLTPDQMDEARQIMQDIDSLDGHTAFLFDKINFLMNATVGFININQNKIVRLFSVAAVALLPPTLIASIYGMNFKHMPELEWMNGYPFALSLMAISIVLPLLVFYRKGWLK